MKQIELNNLELKRILNTFLEDLQKFPRNLMQYNKPSKKEFTLDYVCGEKYLEHMQGKIVTGFPEETFGTNLMRNNIKGLEKSLQKLDNDLLAWSGSRNNAVKMLYPKGGFMGWHHNANASGYNILLSWSENGTGFFRYQDPVTKEIITMNDSPGWTCKVGYYGKFSEPEKTYWHCAGAPHEERFTLGYIIPHKGMWENMTEDIEST